MRLDKYLQVTGLIKRRVLATEACRRSLVKVNGSPVKPTREVTAGDVIEISLAHRLLEVKVIQEITGNSLKKSLRQEYFTIVRDESRAGELDDFWKDDGPDEE